MKVLHDLFKFTTANESVGADLRAATTQAWSVAAQERCSHIENRIFKKGCASIFCMRAVCCKIAPSSPGRIGIDPGHCTGQNYGLRSFVMNKRLLFLILSFASPLLGQVAPPNAAGVSMGHVHIVTPDSEAQKRVWIDVLGGKLVKAGPLEYALFPGVLIGFRKGDSNGGTEGSVLNRLGFVVRDATSVEQKFSAAGIQVSAMTPGSQQFTAVLPDGVKLEITEDKTLDVPIKHFHLYFVTNQVEEMRAWYGKLFGSVSGTRGKTQIADLPGVNLSWAPSETPMQPTKGRALDHIGFEVKDIKKFCSELEAAGLKLDMPPTPRPDLGITIAFITDAWGTRIELTEGLNKF